MLAKINAFRWDVTLVFFVLIELSCRIPRLLKTRLFILTPR